MKQEARANVLSLDDLVTLKQTGFGRDVLKGIIKDIQAGGPEGQRLLRQLGVSGQEFGRFLASGVLEGFESVSQFRLQEAVRQKVAVIEREIEVSKGRLQDAARTVNDAIDAEFDARLAQELPAERALREFTERRQKAAQQEQLNSVEQTAKEAQARLNKLLAAPGQGRVLGTGRNPVTGKIEQRRARTPAQNAEIAAARDELKRANEAVNSTRQQIADDNEEARCRAAAVAARRKFDARVRAERQRAHEDVTTYINAVIKALENQDPEALAKARANLMNALAKADGPNGWTMAGNTIAGSVTSGFDEALFGKNGLITRGEKARRQLIKLLNVTGPAQVPGPQTAPAVPNEPQTHRAPRPPGRAGVSAQKEQDAGVLLDRYNKGQGFIDSRRLAGESDIDILEELIRRGFVGRKRVRRDIRLLGLTSLRSQFAEGGPVPGFGPVPILAHGGEWILNSSQQLMAARMAGVSPERMSQLLFDRTLGAGARAATGGVVASGATVNAPITINNPMAPIDPNYLARALEARMRSVA